jgi:NAD(P)-dependent dehydrogenase (short-subunit alcohol dehydrogenase family)
MAKLKLPFAYHDLKGRSVYITGGGAGIGAWLTEGFIASGAKVTFIQRADATEFCDRIEADYGTRPLFIPCDVTDVTNLEASMEQAKATHGPISVLVNNAAADTRHTHANYEVADWDQAMNVNLRPHFFTAKAAAPDMAKAGGGTIINLSSISYMMGNAGYPAYVAAKAGIMGLTRAQAREFGPENIRVNALMPGWVMTDRQRDLWVTQDALQTHISRQCLPKEIEPIDMIGPTLFLASAASSVMTGQAVVVDGGVVTTG